MVTNLLDYSWFFQQVLLNLSTFNNSISCEMDIYVFSKSTRIIITDSFGISKC